MSKQEIKGIHQRLTNLERQLHDLRSDDPHQGAPGNQQRPNGQAEQADAVSSPVPRAIQPVNPSVAHQETTYGKYTKRLRKANPWIEAIGLVTLIVYTTYTGCTLSAIHDSNKINLEALRSVQRAFVNTKGPNVTISTQ